MAHEVHPCLNNQSMTFYILWTLFYTTPMCLSCPAGYDVQAPIFVTSGMHISSVHEEQNKKAETIELERLTASL